MRQRSRLALTAAFVLFGLVGSGRSPLFAAPPAGSRTPDPARDLEQRRERIIRDYVAWAAELADQHPIGGAGVSLSDSTAPSTELVHYLQRLTRLRAVEALELGLAHLGLTVAESQGERRPGVDLLESIGRPAALRLVEQLSADPAAPEPLREALRRIEGQDADALLRRRAPSDPLPAPPLRRAAAGGLEVRFLQLPGIPLPEYADHGTETVLDLASGERREGPNFAETALNRASLAAAIDAVRSTGDVALIGEFMIVSSRRYARFPTGDLESLAGRDLSRYLQEGDATTILEKRQVWLLQTLEGKFALLQYLGKFDGEALLAYVVQPDGSARFPLAPLPSPTSFRARAGVTPAAMMAHGLLIYEREIAFWNDYFAVVEQLAETVSRGATPDEREAALRHIANLRAVEAAESVVAHLAVEATRSAADAGFSALAAIWPAARAQLQAALAAADPASRSRLAAWLERLDGPTTADPARPGREVRGR